MSSLLPSHSSDAPLVFTSPHTQARYRVLRMLGEGGMGIAYEAIRENIRENIREDIPTNTSTDIDKKERLFLKQLKLSHANSWKTIELFEREAQVLQQLKHPNIPAYIDFFQDPQHGQHGFVLVQKYLHVDGQPAPTLQTLLQSHQPLDVPTFLQYTQNILELLQYLHTQVPPVIHRDVTPKNLICLDGQIHLVDFGAVKSALRESTQVTSVGTFGYMAPEQMLGQAVPASDLYGAGMSLICVALKMTPNDLPIDPESSMVDVWQVGKLLRDAGLPMQLILVLQGLIRGALKERITSAAQALKMLGSLGSLGSMGSTGSTAQQTSKNTTNNTLKNTDLTPHEQARLMQEQEKIERTIEEVYAQKQRALLPKRPGFFRRLFGPKDEESSDWHGLLDEALIHPDAKRRLKLWIQIYTRFAGADQFCGHWFLAKNYKQSGRYKEAVKSYQEFLQHLFDDTLNASANTSANTSTLTAWMMFAQQKLEEAQEAWHKERAQAEQEEFQKSVYKQQRQQEKQERQEEKQKKREQKELEEQEKLAQEQARKKAREQAKAYAKELGRAEKIELTAEERIQQHRELERIAVAKGRYKKKRFVKTHNGCIIDMTTGLMWGREPIGPHTWHDAPQVAKEATYAYFTDWRIPTAEEVRRYRSDHRDHTNESLPDLSGHVWCADPLKDGFVLRFSFDRGQIQQVKPNKASNVLLVRKYEDA